MKVLTSISIAIIIILALFVVQYREQNPDGLVSALNNLSETQQINNPILKELLPYKNPYQENFTINDFVLNTGHVIVYPMIYEFHTIIGTTVNLSWKYLTKESFKQFIQIVLSCIAIYLILVAVKPTAILYVLIEEYFENKKVKVHKALIIALAITTMLLLTALVIAFVIWMSM